jgi:prepilin-type N-terminal cleavage/methylation domain-containing protein
MTTTTPSPSPRRRQGFTLVEVLVAMALIVFIMVILTEAFGAGFGVFRALKSQGDMQERLRLTESLLRDDLVHYHFDATEKLSTLDANNPPTAGYFYIQQGASSREPVGSPPLADSYTLYSYVMNATPPVMCFTVNRYTPPNVPPVLTEKGYLPNGFFAARIPDAPGNPGPMPALGLNNEQPLFNCGPIDYLPNPAALRWSTTNTGSGNNVFLSQWAEVAYFLVPTGKTAGTTIPPGATSPPPLYSLRRRVRVILDPSAGTNEKTANSSLNGTARIPNTPVASTPASDIYNDRYAEMSCFPDTTGNLYFNSPTDLWSNAANRMYNISAVQAGAPNPSWNTTLGAGQGQVSWAGDDLVITDVISFNVRVLLTGASDFSDVSGTYDSSTVTNGQLTPIRALEITIRVWDVKTSLARQITLVQDM